MGSFAGKNYNDLLPKVKLGFRGPMMFAEDLDKGSFLLKKQMFFEML